MVYISSPSNPRIKGLIRLQKSASRRQQDLVLIDGRREIELAIASGLEIKEIFYCPELAAKEKSIPESWQGQFLVTKAVFKKVCYKEKPDGFLAVARPKKCALKDIILPKKPLIVILENVEKPGNLGAIARTAYAAGIDLIIVNDSQTDIYSPNVVRASEGLIFALPIVSISREETISWLKRKKIASLAAATSAAHDCYKADFKKGVALVFGSEADGLSREWLTESDGQIRIPMRPGVDSLNVSVSAAIVIYEALRQRGGIDKN